MRQDEFLLTVLGIAILLNVLLVLASWLGSRRVRRSRASAAQQPPPDQLAGLPAAPLVAADRADDGRVAAAVEAFVAGVSPDAAGSGRVPTPAEVLASRENALRSALASMPPVHLPSATAGPTKAIDRAPPGPAEEAGSESWERILSEESARVARFGRPSTVVTASLPHLEDVADRWGRDAADRVVAETARLLESEGRAVDRIARLDDATFGILLPETSEIGAARYAERVRAAADAWLMSGGLSVRLEIGWAHVASAADAEAEASAARPPKRKATRR